MNLSIRTARLSRAPEPRLLSLIVRYDHLNDFACGTCCVCRCNCDVVEAVAAISQPVRFQLHMMGVYDDPFARASCGRGFVAGDGQCR